MKNFGKGAALAAMCALQIGCGGGDFSPLMTDEDGVVEETPGRAIEGLSESVEVYRDDLGIFHIFAQSDRDAAWANGFVMARDRLFQMDFMRRRASGRLSELFGRDKLNDDRLARLMNFYGYSTQDGEWLKENDPAIYEIFGGFVDGINQLIIDVEAGDEPMPHGYEQIGATPEPWNIVDVIAVTKLVLFANQQGIEKEALASALHRLNPELLDAVQLLKPARDSYAVPESARPTAQIASSPAPLRRPLSLTPQQRDQLRTALDQLRESMSPLDLNGSNNWAVAGEHTDNGRPIIANDPHQGLESPSLMFPIHLNSLAGGGTFDIAGFSFVGAPGVQLGRNRNIAWTATNSFPDTTDMWEVDIADGMISLGGEELELVERVEIIMARDEGDDGELLDTFTEVRYVAQEVPGRGVVLQDHIIPTALIVRRPGAKLLFQWTGFQVTPESSIFFQLLRSENLDEFEAAAVQSEIAAFNFVAADKDGITYRTGVNVPLRDPQPGDWQPWEIYDGNDADTLWTGEYLTPDQLPHARDPEEGYIITANNDPLGFTDNGTITDDPWYYGSFFAPGWRGDRLESEMDRLIATGDGISSEDMQRMQMDSYSELATDLIPILASIFADLAETEALAEFQDDAELAALFAQLEDWDRFMTREQKAPVAFHYFAHFLTKRAVADDVSPLFEQIMNVNAPYLLKIVSLAARGEFEDNDFIFQEGRDLLFMQALDDTRDAIVARWDSLDADYTWGEVHGNSFSSRYDKWIPETNYGYVPTDGAEDTVTPANSRFFEGDGPRERFESGAGAIFRTVTTFDEDGTPEVMVNFPIGASGDPTNEHWDDRIDDWTNGVFRPFLFERDEIEDDAQSNFTLEPRAQ